MDAPIRRLQHLVDSLLLLARTVEEVGDCASELSNRLAAALKGKQFKLAQAMPIAHTCWETVAARQLSEKQVEGLKAEMKSQLMSLGVADPQAQNVADQVGVVQQAVTARHRRWYELL